MGRKKSDAENAKKATPETLTQVDDNIWTLVYNGSYMVPEIIFSVIGAVILFSLSQTKKLIQPVTE